MNEQPGAKQNAAVDGRQAGAVPSRIHALREDVNGSKCTWQPRLKGATEAQPLSNRQERISSAEGQGNAEEE